MRLERTPRGLRPLGRVKLPEHTFKNVAEPQNFAGEVIMVDEQVDEVAEEGEVIDELDPPQQEKSGFGLGSTADGSDDPIIDEPVDEWLDGISFDSTADVPIPDTLVDQVIGQ